MPQYHFFEVWTPLKLIGIRFFRDDENELWIKVFNRRRKPLRSNKKET